MTPAETRGGSSFKGAALYYLHDKRLPGEAERFSDDRVAWTHVCNLPTEDADRAWRMMAHTALAQADIKAAAGEKSTGRKLEKPVYAYSLSWHPEEKPSRDEMRTAALDSMKALGIADHQAIIVCHTDTKHPHVHILANRVHPVTGLAARLSHSWTHLSDWALAYQAARGQTYCPERIKSHARRNGRTVEEVARRIRRMTRPEWEASAGRRKADTAKTVRQALGGRFADQTAAERFAKRTRETETVRFYRDRKNARDAIRVRHDAAAEAGRSGETAREHARMAELLIRGKPALSLAELTRNRSTFTRADLARLVGQHTDAPGIFQAVMAKLESSPELVRLGRDARGRERFTTQHQQAVEQAMERHARLLHATKRPGGDVAPQRAGRGLSADQEAALRHVLGPAQLANVIGYAGTGKSTMLRAARASWEAAGYKVIGAALSGVAADGLKHGAGIDSRTIHSRLYQWEQGIDRLTAKHVLVIDEAGMVASRQMEQLLKRAVEAKAKVVLVGDPQQLQAIEAGGAFKAIIDRTGAAELTTVRRHKAAWQQEATKELATGRTGEALKRYEDAGMVHAHSRQADAKKAVADAWHQARKERPGQSQIILAHTRKDVRELNELARAKLRADGTLGADRSFKIEGGQRAFAEQDRIYFLKNDTALNVRNGSLGTIERISGKTLTVRMDGEAGCTVTFGTDAYGHIDHGYAATIHKSQGVTVDRAHVLAGRGFDRHLAYVAMTRHRDRLDLHWSQEAIPNRKRLESVLSREAIKDTSLDYGEAIDMRAEAKRQAAVDTRARIERRAAVFAEREKTPAGRMQNARSLAAKNARPLDVAKLAVNTRQRALLFKKREATLKRWARALDKAGPQTAPPPPKVKVQAKASRLADLVAFDKDTKRLADAMQVRHADATKVEHADRRQLRRSAVSEWQHARDVAHQEIAADLERGRRPDAQRSWSAVQGTAEPSSAKPVLPRGPTLER